MNLAASNYYILAFPVASFGLGVWQIQRLQWKKELIARLQERLTAKPIGLVEIDSINDLSDMQYRRVKVKGKFDHNLDRQVLISPAILNVNDESISRGISPKIACTGVNVITPFQVSDTNLQILVNRGWLPKQGPNSVQNSLGQGLGKKDEDMEITGFIRLSDERSRYVGKNQVGSSEWQVRDIEGMAKTLGTAPIFIDADESLSKGSGPIGGQTRLNVRNEHLNYIITWFGLSACSLLMWYQVYGKKSFRFIKS